MSAADLAEPSVIDIEDVAIGQYGLSLPNIDSNTGNLEDGPEQSVTLQSQVPSELRRSISLLPPDINVADMTPKLPDPLIIRGCGTLVVFGLSNRFPSEFPPSLIGKIASEEYCGTIKRINFLLSRSQSARARWLIFACICCFCTLSASLWPVTCLAKRTRAQLEKLLDWENNRLYYKLGFRWRLVSLRSDSTMLREYAIALEHLPRVYLNLPD